MFSWNLQGKDFENLAYVWPETFLEPDVVFLQELGGTYEYDDKPFAAVLFCPQGCFEYEATVCSPKACFRQVAVFVRRQLVPVVLRTSVLSAGAVLQLWAPQSLTQSSHLYVGSFHLPHKQREDCADTWYGTSAELHATLSRMRHFDHLVFGIDANLEFCNACDGSPRSLYARDLLNSLGLACTSPQTRTWWNYRASSRIDYILQYGPASIFARQGVNEDIAHVLGVDHALVHANIPLLHVLPREGRR